MHWWLHGHRRQGWWVWRVWGAALLWTGRKVGRNVSVGGALVWKARCNPILIIFIKCKILSVEEYVDSPVWQRVLSHPWSAVGTDSLMAFMPPLPCAFRCINFFGYVKNPQRWQPDRCLDNMKTLHTPIGMGSAALAASVALPRWGNSKLLQEINKWNIKEEKEIFLHAPVSWKPKPISVGCSWRIGMPITTGVERMLFMCEFTL